MIRACIFDLDGTLLDTISSIRHYVNSELKRLGYDGISEEQAKLFVGDGAKALIRRSLIAKGHFSGGAENAEELDRITKEYVEEYDKNPYFLTKPYDGIPGALKILLDDGIKLAVLSNKPHTTVVPLVERYFPGAFSVVLGSEPGVPAKPAPDAALKICEVLGTDPSEVAYFGDTATDIKTAKAFRAGVGVGVLWGFRSKEELLSEGADVLIDNPQQIVRVALGNF